ncbi:intraflagellar transport protein 46 homolog [Prorops nasuta]|uniref:intraflagellar transport protein 46 homolog n=1 Tax=Prorops nasuta TaxID=863751 RepID=UPI0034CF054D
MDIREISSEEEDSGNLAFGKFDESIVVRNAEEVRSPSVERPSTARRGRHTLSSKIQSPNKRQERYMERDDKISRQVNLGSEPSDSEETDEDEIQENAKVIQLYDPGEFEDLQVSAEIKELFQNITRYTPQKVELNYKLIPFIPDYIPAVGDIDAFIKVPRPDNVTDQIGLAVLDEPCTEQSDPVVLHLQLRSQSKSAGASRQVAIKRIENAEKNSKAIDKWIEDMNRLHRSKHPSIVQLSKPLPDIDMLMQRWPPEVQQQRQLEQLRDKFFEFGLTEIIDKICQLLEITVQQDKRLESLHIIFSLYLEIKSLDMHRMQEMIKIN